MEHAELVNTLLTVHAAVGGTSIAVFYYYSDRSDSSITPLNGTTSVLGELRRRIAGDLQDHLDPIFKERSVVPSPLLGPSGGTYFEKAVNPVASEVFRERVRDFIDASGDLIDDYRTLLNARRRWCSWCTRLSAILIVLIVWQIIFILILFLHKSSFFGLPDVTIYSGSAATALLVVLCIGCVILRLYHFSTITSLRLKHGQL